MDGVLCTRGLSAHVCKDPGIISDIWMDFRVKYESAEEGLSAPPLTAWSQAAFEPAFLSFFLKIGLFSHCTLE